MRPTGTRVLVRLDPRATTYVPGGIVQTHDLSYVQPTTGTVVARGVRAPDELQPGVRVTFGKFNGLQVDPKHAPDTDHEYWIMDARHDKPVPHVPDVYGVIEDA